jgi:hypothetical protein
MAFVHGVTRTTAASMLWLTALATGCPSGETTRGSDPTSPSTSGVDTSTGEPSGSTSGASTTGDATTSTTTTGTTQSADASSTGEPGTTTDEPGTTTGEPGTTTGEPTTETSESTGVDPCGNGVIDGDEACDGAALDGQTCITAGFDFGEISCDAECALDTSGCGTRTCGNGLIDGSETCDGNLLDGENCISQGFVGGGLQCADNCGAFDTSNCVAQICGDGQIDDTEVCDGGNLGGSTCVSLGHDGGVLSCAAGCLAFNENLCSDCGDGVREGPETCDGGDLGGQSCTGLGYDDGVLGCNAACNGFVTTDCSDCGNGVREGDEQCDGIDLGGANCGSVGMLDGSLACNAQCGFVVSACGAPFGSDTGYTGYEFHGVALPCDDILATGTPTLLTDDSVLAVPMGFVFPLYGVNFADVAIQSNGALHFGDASYMTFANTCLPTVTAPTDYNVYAFWDDLNPGAVGASEIYYQTLGMGASQRFVVQWDTAHFGGDANDLIRVQVMLTPSTGEIAVCYPDTLSAANVGDNGAEATSGIQRTTNDGFSYSCNTPEITSGTLLRYVPS